MKELLIEKIQISEIGEVAEILTCAFETNPAYSLIFKEDNRRKEGLNWVFKTSLILNNQNQTLTRVIKEKDTEKIIGTYTIIPPQGVKIDIASLSKIGIIGFIFKFGLKTLIRMLRLDDCNKQTLKQSMKTDEFHYLSMVVIRKEYRGGGVGSYTIKQAIQELTSSNPNNKLIGLTTQLPENVTFYSRLGFEKLDEGYIEFNRDKYYNYNMKLKL